MTTLYVTGTVSVTAGSRVVTGVGTGWQTALIVGGLFGLDAAGQAPVPIRSIDSDTSLTLEKPWRGASASAQEYWIFRDTSAGRQAGANANTLAQIISELRSTPLAALAGLTPAADKVPYFNSAGSAVLSDIKAKGRDILGAATTLELLGKLGPSLGGVAPTPGAADVGLLDGDFNSLIIPGVYTISGNYVNSPFGAASTGVAGILLVYVRQFNNLYVQEYLVGERRFRRTNTTSGGLTGWGAWRAIAGEIVGSVANASGFPSGAIIERGSNANGDYVRFADGTQMCMVSGLAGGPTTAYANVFRSEVITWTYPVAFSSAATYGGAASAGNTNFWAAGNFAATTNCAIRLWSVAASGSGTTVNAVAIGRWF